MFNILLDNFTEFFEVHFAILVNISSVYQWVDMLVCELLRSLLKHSPKLFSINEAIHIFVNCVEIVPNLLNLTRGKMLGLEKTSFVFG
jgi:hypothetical protein